MRFYYDKKGRINKSQSSFSLGDGELLVNRQYFYNEKNRLVKIDEITRNACFRSTPQTGTKVRIIKILIRKSMYFRTSLILGFEKPDFFPNLPTRVEITNLISKEKSSTTAVATISR